MILAEVGCTAELAAEAELNVGARRSKCNLNATLATARLEAMLSFLQWPVANTSVFYLRKNQVKRYNNATMSQKWFLNDLSFFSLRILFILEIFFLIINIVNNYYLIYPNLFLF